MPNQISHPVTLSTADPTGTTVTYTGVRTQDSASPTPPTPPRKPRSAAGGSGAHSHQIVSGARRVKGYPVTRDELFGLGGVGLLTTVCFSAGGNFISRSYDIEKDLALSQGVSDALKARWEAKAQDAWLFGAILIAVGLVTVFVGGAKIFSIIRSTEHPDE